MNINEMNPFGTLVEILDSGLFWRLSFLRVWEQPKCPKSNLRRCEGTRSGTTGSTFGTSDSFLGASWQESAGTRERLVLK